jgi:hypothetical protein
MKPLAILLATASILGASWCWNQFGDSWNQLWAFRGTICALGLVLAWVIYLLDEEEPGATV